MRPFAQRRGILLASALAASIACGDILSSDEDEAAPPRVGAEAGADGAGPGATDAASSDGGPDVADGGVDAGRCADDLPFAAPELLDAWDDLGDVSSVRVARDGKTALFAVDAGPPTYADIHQGPYPPQKNLVYPSIVGDPYGELSPAPLADLLTVYYEQAPITSGPHVIVAATRQQPDQNLDPPAVQALPVDADAGVGEPWSVAGAHVLYYAVRPGTAGSADIHRAEKIGGVWAGGPQAGLSSALDESSPVVSDDEHTIYFVRGGGASDDVSIATRADEDAAWGAIVPLPEPLNSSGAERPTWISPDNCTLVFTSDRTGRVRPYRATRVR